MSEEKKLRNSYGHELVCQIQCNGFRPEAGKAVFISLGLGDGQTQTALSLF